MKPGGIRLTVMLVLGIVCVSPIADAQPAKVHRIGCLTAGKTGEVISAFHEGAYRRALRDQQLPQR